MKSTDGSSNTQLQADRANDDTLENSPLYDTIANGSKPKIQMLELAENIQAAETQYDSIKLQWDYMKTLRRNSVHNGSTLSQNSVSSLNSLKLLSSENSIQKYEEPDNNAELAEVTVVPLQQPFEQVQSDAAGHQMLVNQISELNSEGCDRVNEVDQGHLCKSLECGHRESARSLQNTSKRSKKGKKRPVLNETYDAPESAKNQFYNPSKTKKKKFRIKNSNSKSTVATRDISVNKKNDRRKFRRQKSVDTMTTSTGPHNRKKAHYYKEQGAKKLNSNDIVEIYHNSAVDSRDNPVKIVINEASKISRLQKEVDKATGDSENKIDFNDQINDNLSCFDPDSTDENDKKNAAKGDGHKCGHEGHACGYEGHTCGQNYYDFFAQRNYEMPTKASEMKRVRRSYYNHYNVRHIPFVVGTSITPSYNLGLNIQQVLSIIKSKQPAIPGISPVLIQKVTKGVRPVTTLLDQINNQYPTISSQHIKDEVYNRMGNNELNHQNDDYEDLRIPVKNQTSQYNQGIYEPLFEVDEETRSTCSKTPSKVNGKSAFDRKPDDNTRKSAEPQQQVEKYRSHNLKKSRRFSDLCNNDYCPPEEFNYPSNNKDMAEVFSRLYDQFDKMITQHEKLKDQWEKKKDKALAKELAELEETIGEKEQEIAAVVNLYKEVMSLKQQMKLLHERNSFVCIASQDPAFGNVSKNALVKRARTAGPFPQISHHHHHCRPGYVQETPNALRLAGLLKRIQAFHRQISLI